MRIILVRHGQTKENELGIILGQHDGILTRDGEEGARKLKRTLEKYPINTVYSSDLGRCVRTANILTEGRGLEVKLDPRLREINFGDYQGEFCSVVQGDYVTNLQKSFPNGESNIQMIRRVIDAINDILKDNQGKTVLIVTHSGPISVIRAATEKSRFINLINNKAVHNDILELTITSKLAYPQ
jgi:broad specificity phosphatase PhoE